MTAFARLQREVRACSLCSEHLPLGPRPVIRMRPGARLLIIGQAPGTKVHESGVPWQDASGDRLREWLSLPSETFDDPEQVAIMPMGFCYPGRQDKGGDKPPRPECAPQWHNALREQLPAVELTLLVGTYAQKYYLGQRARRTLTETVRTWADYQPDFFPLPHPSWRSTLFQRKNPWFEEEVLPALRDRLRTLFG